GQAMSNIPPYYLGYNPYPQAINYGPSFPTITPYGGSTLSTVGAYNPYMGGASLATNPYLGGSTLSTAAYGGSPGYGGGYGGYGGGYLDPYLSASNPYNGYLRGAADVTTANAN